MGNFFHDDKNLLIISACWPQMIWQWISPKSCLQNSGEAFMNLQQRQMAGYWQMVLIMNATKKLERQDSFIMLHFMMKDWYRSTCSDWDSSSSSALLRDKNTDRYHAKVEIIALAKYNSINARLKNRLKESKDKVTDFRKAMINNLWHGPYRMDHYSRESL